MEYRKLNLIDGPDQDLHDFMRLLNVALEAGHTQVNMEVLAPMIAGGVIEAFVAVSPEGAVVGMQVWDIGHPWNIAIKHCALRVLFFEAAHDTPAAKVAFMNAGTTQMRATHAQAKLVVVQMPAPGYEFLEHCGFTPCATLYELP